MIINLRLICSIGKKLLSLIHFTAGVYLKVLGSDNNPKENDNQPANY